MCRDRQDSIFMTFQHLLDFTRLQIVQDNVTILGARNNRLSIRGKVCDNGIFRIHVVTGICFGTPVAARLCNRPQPQGRVERPRQQVPPVRSVLERRDGRITSSVNSLEAFSRGDIPHADQSIVARTADAGSIPIETDRRDGVAVRRQCTDAISTADIPQFDSFVKGTRHHHGVVLIHTKDKIIVSPEFHECVAGNSVPETHRLVVTGGGEQGRQRIPTHIVNAPRVTDTCLNGR